MPKPSAKPKAKSRLAKSAKPRATNAPRDPRRGKPKARSAKASKPRSAKRPAKASRPRSVKRPAKVIKRRALKPPPAARSIAPAAPRTVPPPQPPLAAPLLKAPAPRSPQGPAALIGVRKPVVAAAQAAPPAALQRPTLIPTLPEAKRTLPREAPNAAALQRIDDCARRLGIALPDAEFRRALGAVLGGGDALAFTADFSAVSLAAVATAEQIRQPTLLISPLASELRALGERLAGERLNVVRVNGSLAAGERSKALSRVEQGGSLLVLLAPGELRKHDLARACARAGVGLVIADEVHVLSSWTHELRPSLETLPEVLQQWGRPPLLALTRPVPIALRHDIADRLALRRPALAEVSPFRDNVVLSSFVARGEMRQARLLELLQRLPPPGVIYCALPHDVDAVYAGLCAMRLTAHRHHAGLPPAERAQELEAWRAAGRRGIMVTTSGFATPSGALGLGEDEDPTAASFGRGLARRDVRFVIHYQAPPSLEQYVREIALAGADGERADAVLLYESAHRSLNDALLAQQRFRAQHVEALARALEAAALENRPLTIEALALTSGQSRRTTDRLASLAADAGAIEKVAGWVRPTLAAGELAGVCRKLASRLSDLRAQDARRLDAVGEYAEAPGCRSAALSRYFGLDQGRCGRCSFCAPVASDARPADFSGQVRRPAVQQFSVSPAQVATHSERQAAPLTAKLADFAGR